MGPDTITSQGPLSCARTASGRDPSTYGGSPHRGTLEKPEAQVGRWFRHSPNRAISSSLTAV